MYKIFVDAHVFDGEFQGTLTYIKELYLKILDDNSDVIIYFGARKIENVKKVFGDYSNVKYIEYSSISSFKRIFVEIPKIIDYIEKHIDWYGIISNGIAQLWSEREWLK